MHAYQKVGNSQEASLGPAKGRSRDRRLWDRQPRYMNKSEMKTVRQFLRKRRCLGGHRKKVPKRLASEVRSRVGRK